LSIELTWKLSQLWYGDRLRPEYHGRSLDEAVGIFTQLGLSGDFWSPSV